MERSRQSSPGITFGNIAAAASPETEAETVSEAETNGAEDC